MPDFMLESNNLVKPTNLDDFTTLQLAQALIARLTISPNDWHKLKSNRQARSREQAAAALVFLLKDSPDEALSRLQQSFCQILASPNGRPRIGQSLAWRLG